MEEQEKWHIDKGVSVPAVIMAFLAITGFVLGGLFAFTRVSERLTVLEQEFLSLNQRVVRVLEAQQRIDDAQDRELQSFRSEMRTDIQQINDKLDRLTEVLIDR